MLLLPSALSVLVILGGCSALDPLSFLTGGGGPNVAAATQLGQENEQTLGVRTSSDSTQSITRPQARDITQTSDKVGVKADNAETITVQNIPPWVLVLLVLGWLLPSPGEIGRMIRAVFKRKA
jgi:hypothetical protein